MKGKGGNQNQQRSALSAANNMAMASLENVAPVLALEDKSASKGSSPQTANEEAEGEDAGEEDDEDRKVGFGNESVVEIEQSKEEFPSEPNSPTQGGGKGQLQSFKPVDLQVNFGNGMSGMMGMGAMGGNVMNMGMQQQN
jgi:hypothetical protein